MVFSSILFLLYFLPLFLLVYYLLPYKLRNPWILLASVLFYSWGAFQKMSSPMKHSGISIRWFILIII